MTRLNDLLEWYSTLTADSVKLAVDYYHPNAHFKDPFNDVVGVEALMHIFDHMFLTTEHPRFIIKDTIMQDRQAFVSWIFKFTLKGKHYEIAGATHLKFNATGMVTQHRDYWDAAEELFEKLPLIGAPVRWLRRQFRVP